jgi:hypothetical protein
MAVVVVVGHDRVLVLLVRAVLAVVVTVQTPQQPLQEPPTLVEEAVGVVLMVVSLVVREAQEL